MKGICTNTGRTHFKKIHNIPPRREIGNAEYMRRLRHIRGISKKYSIKYGGIKVLKKFSRKRYKNLVRNGGVLLVSTVQQVYENNIKKHGTLTCVYCIKPIEFGNDTLEHKMPLSRGGNNELENLDIACHSCNASKRDKPQEEYLKWRENLRVAD